MVGIDGHGQGGGIYDVSMRSGFDFDAIIGFLFLLRHTK